MTRPTREVVALMMAATLGVFIIASLACVFVLALYGHALDDVWAALFSLVMAVLGALAGYLSGSAMDGKRPPPTG